MGSSDLAYEIADTVVGDREELDRLAAFFPEDAMVGTLRTKLSLEETVQHLSLDEKGSSDEWTRKIQETVDNTKGLMDRAVKTKDVETIQQFLLDPRSVSTKTMTQALGVQGRLRDVAYFMGMIAASIKAKQPESNQIDRFNTSIKDLSEMAKVLSEGVESVFAIRTRLTPIGMISAFLTELGESPVEKEGEQTDEEVRLASIRKFLEKRGAGETTRNHKELIKLFDVSIKGRSLDEIKKIEDDHKKEVLKIKTGYRTQFDSVLGGVESLKILLEALYTKEIGTTMMKSSKTRDVLENAGVITNEGFWNIFKPKDKDPKVWIRTETETQPGGAIIIVDAASSPLPSAPLDTTKPIFEYNFEKDIKDGRGIISIIEPPAASEDIDAELKRRASETESALKILKFFSGDVVGRTVAKTYHDSTGVVEKLLNHRGALAQSTGNIEGAYKTQYSEMAEAVKKVSKDIQKYEKDRKVTGEDSALVSNLQKAEIIHTEPNQDHEWLLPKGEGYRTGGAWPFGSPPFRIKNMEGVTVDDLNASHPKKIKNAIESIEKAYWEAVRGQEALAIVVRDKVLEMRTTIFSIFNDTLVTGGLDAPTDNIGGGTITVQKRLQQAGKDVFDDTWQNWKVKRMTPGTKSVPILNEDIEREMANPKKTADWDVSFKRIANTQTEALKDIPVENLLKGLIKDPIEPVMKSFGAIFERLNQADAGVHKLGLFILGEDGIENVISQSQRLDKWVDEKVVEDTLGIKQFSQAISLMEGLGTEKGLRPRDIYITTKRANLDASEKTFQISHMVSEIRAFYQLVQDDAISAMRVLERCAQQGAGAIIPEAMLKELEIAGVPSIDTVYKQIAETVLYTMYNTDGNTPTIKFDNRNPKSRTGEFIDGLGMIEYPKKEPNVEHIWVDVFGRKGLDEEFMDDDDSDKMTEMGVALLMEPVDITKLDSLDAIKKFLAKVVKSLTRERLVAIKRMWALHTDNFRQAEKITRLDAEIKTTSEKQTELVAFEGKFTRGKEEFEALKQGAIAIVSAVEKASVFGKNNLNVPTLVISDQFFNTLSGEFGELPRIEIPKGKTVLKLSQDIGEFLSVERGIGRFLKLANETYTDFIKTTNKNVGIASAKILSALLKFEAPEIMGPGVTTSKGSDIPSALVALAKVEEVLKTGARSVNKQTKDLEERIEILTKEKETLESSKEKQDDSLKEKIAQINEVEVECKNQKAQLEKNWTTQKNALTTQIKNLKDLWDVERKGLERNVTRLKADIKSLDAELNKATASAALAIDDAMEEIEMAEERAEEAVGEDVFNKLQTELNAALTTLEEKTALSSRLIDLFDKVLRRVALLNAKVASGFGRTEIDLELKTVRAFRKGEPTRADETAGIERDGVKTLENWTEKMRKYLEVLPDAVEKIYSLLAQENDRRQGVIDGLETEKTTFESTKTALTEKVGELEENARGFEGAFNELAVPLERVIRVIFKVYKNFNDDSLESKETMVLKSGYDPDGFMKWFRPISGSIVSDLTRLFTFYDDDIHDLKNQITTKEGELDDLVTKKEALDTRVEGFEVEKAKAVEDATTKLTKQADVLRTGNRVLRADDKKLNEELIELRGVKKQANRFAVDNETLREQFAEAKEAIRRFLADNIETNTEMEHLREELKQASLLAIRPPSTTGPAVTGLESLLQEDIKEKEDEIDLLKAEMEKLKGLKITFPVIKEILDAMWILPSPLQDRFTREKIRALEETKEALDFAGRDSGEIENTLAAMRTANIQADANGFLSSLTKEGGSERSNYVAHLTHIRNNLDENIVIPELRNTIYTRALEMFPYKYSAELDDEDTEQRFISVISGVLALAGITGPVFTHDAKMRLEMERLLAQIPEVPGVVRKRRRGNDAPSSLPAEFSIRELQLMKRNPTKMSEMIHLISSVKLTAANGSTSARIEEIVPEEEEKDNEPDDGWSLWL